MTADTSQIDLSGALDAVARSLRTTVLRTAGDADNLYTQLVAAAAIRAAEPHIAYRLDDSGTDTSRRLGLTVGDWTITAAAANAVARLLSQQFVGTDATDAQIRYAAVHALYAALNAQTR